jgi:hypothetical protein
VAIKAARRAMPATDDVDEGASEGAGATAGTTEIDGGASRD